MQNKATKVVVLKTQNIYHDTDAETIDVFFKQTPVNGDRIQLESTYRVVYTLHIQQNPDNQDLYPVVYVVKDIPIES